jgi:hypothetical protein
MNSLKLKPEAIHNLTFPHHSACLPVINVFKEYITTKNSKKTDRT